MTSTTGMGLLQGGTGLLEPSSGLWQLGAALSEAGASFLEARMGSSRLAYSLVGWPVDSRKWAWSLWKANFSL